MSTDDLRQGEDYEEELLEDDEILDDDDAEVVIDTFYGIPKQYVYIGIAIAVVLVIAIVVFATWGLGKDKEVVEPPLVEEGLEYTVDDDIAYSEPVLEEEVYVEPTPEPVPDIEELTSDDIKMLRSYGYTGDEIDFAIANGFSVTSMMSRAQARLDKASIESWKRTSDTAGEEYKHLMNVTYMGQPAGIPVIDQTALDPEMVVNTMTEVVINADYEKCPNNGMQLYLKCKIANNTYYWHEVRPSRWASLPDRGNIVLKVTFNTWGAGTYIVDAVETDSTLDTIDSSNDIGDVTSGEVSQEETDGGFLTEQEE